MNCLRRSTMKTALLTLAAATLLVGCGNATETTPETQPDPTPTHPTGPPWPEYAATDYTYTLRLSCFCAYRNPWTVTVEDGKVTSVVNKKTGDPAPDGIGDMTINDIIGAANDVKAYQVDVKWPEGQDYPASVYVDRDENSVDEEIGYSIKDVLPS